LFSLFLADPHTNLKSSMSIPVIFKKNFLYNIYIHPMYSILQLYSVCVALQFVNNILYLEKLENFSAYLDFLQSCFLHWNFYSYTFDIVDSFIFYKSFLKVL